MILQLGDDYQIRAHQPGLVIYRRVEAGVVKKGPHAGKAIEGGWRSIERYPHDFAHAMKLIADDYFQQHGKRMSVKEGLNDVAEYVQRIAASSNWLPEPPSE